MNVIAGMVMVWCGGERMEWIRDKWAWAIQMAYNEK
jgi:hypothetical protein